MRLFPITKSRIMQGLCIRSEKPPGVSQKSILYVYKIFQFLCSLKLKKFFQSLEQFFSHRWSEQFWKHNTYHFYLFFLKIGYCWFELWSSTYRRCWQWCCHVSQWWNLQPWRIGDWIEKEKSQLVRCFYHGFRLWSFASFVQDQRLEGSNMALPVMEFQK